MTASSVFRNGCHIILIHNILPQLCHVPTMKVNLTLSTGRKRVDYTSVINNGCAQATKDDATSVIVILGDLRSHLNSPITLSILSSKENQIILQVEVHDEDTRICEENETTSIYFLAPPACKFTVTAIITQKLAKILTHKYLLTLEIIFMNLSQEK